MDAHTAALLQRAADESRGPRPLALGEREAKTLCVISSPEGGERGILPDQRVGRQQGQVVRQGTGDE